jgi:hypothetical protein
MALAERRNAKGHDFSRAENAAKNCQALAPEGQGLTVITKHPLAANAAQRIGAVHGTAEVVPFQNREYQISSVSLVGRVQVLFRLSGA